MHKIYIFTDKHMYKPYQICSEPQFSSLTVCSLSTIFLRHLSSGGSVNLAYFLHYFSLILKLFVYF